MEEIKRKANMTDEERHELAKQMDQELDDFINSREKAPYTEGWTPENWEQEMEKHPFFMNQLPEEGEPLPPLLEAFQQLKYDPNENTTEDLAVAYKDDGNFNFKVKKYRMAITDYTEGLKQKCPNKEVNATLYLNRAASHFHLGNFRSALNDSREAVKLKTDYPKAIIRAAQCCQQLKRYEDGFKWCDYGLKSNSTDKTLLEIRTKLVQDQKLEERNRRKAEAQERREQEAQSALLKILEERGVKIANFKGEIKPLDLSYIEPCHPAALQKRVHLENNVLIWPVLFLYPEHGETDFIEEFNEETTFDEHLEVMFGQERPLWDTEGKYTPDRLCVYFENTTKGALHLVDTKKTLKEVLAHPEYVVKAGTPGFIVLVKSSKFHVEFLQHYQ